MLIYTCMILQNLKVNDSMKMGIEMINNVKITTVNTVVTFSINPKSYNTFTNHEQDWFVSLSSGGVGN